LCCFGETFCGWCAFAFAYDGCVAAGRPVTTTQCNINYNPGTNVGIGYKAGNLCAIRGCRHTLLGAGSTPVVDLALDYVFVPASQYCGARCLCCSCRAGELIFGNNSISCIRANVQTISALSDCRDKKCIQDIPYGLDFINSIRPVSFEWNRGDSGSTIFNGHKDIGFIAQELEAVEQCFCSSKYTHLVDIGDDGRYRADAIRTYPILIKAMVELNNQLDELENEVDAYIGGQS
jgi:hypothetical protein